MRRVILVREWDGQTSGSGCCGRLGGVCDDLGNADDYARSRADMEAMGAVYRGIRRTYPDVHVEICDPRNMFWLIPAIVHDARRRGLRGAEVRAQVRRGVARNAVIVDGLVLHWGEPPAVAPLLDALERELGAAVSR
ncbi:MAG: hypothetical protein GEU74_02080 [Nitriliruptorales bacterium]|nr:hypothetical protein [Nitriliruptorales bacterium]